MSLPTAYTPLETLLLFQALRSEGVNSHSVFNRISDQLKSIPSIRSHPSYDGGRLSPDALRELYLWLLKDEVKSDLERDKVLQNGHPSPNSRKRKAASPHMPTVHEAGQHAHLIPQLVTRLYVRYREHTVREIRENERRYDALAREIEEIEAGKWDERIQRQRTASATQSPRPSTAAHTQRNNGHVTSPVPVPKALDGAANKPFTQNKIDSLINHEPEAINPHAHRRNSSNTTLPPLSQMAPKSPTFGLPPSVPAPAHAPTHPHGYSQSPPAGHHPSFAPSHANPMPQSLSRPSSSPRPILPPPAGMKFPPPSPVQNVGSPGFHGPPASQQPYAPQHSAHRPPIGSAPHDRLPYGYPMPHSASTGHFQPPQYVDHRSPYGPLPQQHPTAAYPHPMAHGGPYQIQPYAQDTQEMAHSRVNHHAMQHPPQNQTPVLQHSPSNVQGGPSRQRHVATAPSTGPRPIRPPHSRLVTDIIAALATPPRQQRRPVWKSEKYLSPVKGGTPIPRPEIEPLSPVLQRPELSGRATRSTRNRGARASEQPDELEALPVPTRSRGRMKRELSPHSVVSSTADESARMTRSQSVSTAGALPEDHFGNRGHVKIEPSTPAGFAEDADTAQEVTSGARMTRKRRGTLQSLQQAPPKKTRRQSVSGVGDEVEVEDAVTPAPRPSTVVATRNFHKLSQTIMNDINSHKHASYFANSVRDKDAPGYSEIIHHPQHLKGIRAAISAGSKAVNAAAAAGESPSVSETPTKTAADGSTTIELERTEDLMPPKAIVNAAQLEKEVLRMFANAVMFNPGEDGLVADTREMFDDVEAKMIEWRGAEKEGGAMGAGVGVDVGDEDEGRGKRRKL